MLLELRLAKIKKSVKYFRLPRGFMRTLLAVCGVKLSQVSDQKNIFQILDGTLRVCCPFLCADGGFDAANAV
jgi:hypothetical protein